jgi:hypothetical protein
MTMLPPRRTRCADVVLHRRAECAAGETVQAPVLQGACAVLRRRCGGFRGERAVDEPCRPGGRDDQTRVWRVRGQQPGAYEPQPDGGVAGARHADGGRP